MVLKSTLSRSKIALAGIVKLVGLRRRGLEADMKMPPSPLMFITAAHANTMARMIWAMLIDKEGYRPAKLARQHKMA